LEDVIAAYVDDVGEAERFYERFHWGNEPEEVTVVSAPVLMPGEVLVQLGELAEIAYDADKGGELARWVHPFEDERPVLAFSSSGRLHIVGGSYTVDRRGIVG
jgi:hypothetical protein